MVRSTLDAPAPASPPRPVPRGRSFRGRLTSVMDVIAGLLLHDPRLHDRRLHGPRPQGPDAGHAPAQYGPADSVARRFATQRDAEATHRIWRSAAVGGGPGLR